jgi:hypothetical protein
MSYKVICESVVLRDSRRSMVAGEAGGSEGKSSDQQYLAVTVTVGYRAFCLVGIPILSFKSYK